MPLDIHGVASKERMQRSHDSLQLVVKILKGATAMLLVPLLLCLKDTFIVNVVSLDVDERRATNLLADFANSCPSLFELQHQFASIRAMLPTVCDVPFDDRLRGPCKSVHSSIYAPIQSANVLSEELPFIRLQLHQNLIVV
jgi:hypothetical protein